jgi:subtilisin family serine protease
VATALLIVSTATFSIAVLGAGQGTGAASSREHLFVGFTQTPRAAEQALIERYGGTVRFSFPSVNALAIDLDTAKIGDLAREAGVSYVEQDPERVPSGLNDLETTQLVPSLTNGLYGLVTTNVVSAHSDGFTGSGVKVCVADTGLDTTHPDIQANFVAGNDVFGGTSSVDVFDLGVETTETHATHVSGILLGVDNTVGILGVATHAQLYEARVLGTQSDGSVSGSTSQVMEGVQWLSDQGCRVVNMSLGGGTRSRTEEALYNHITAGGTLLVAAAGNGGSKKLDYPAGYATVMAVGAVDVNNNHASFSNTGRGLDISAPGVGVLSSVPTGQGRDSFVTAGGTEYTGIGMEFAGTTATTGITATLFDCGYGQDASAFPSGVSGNIALIQRGSPTHRSVSFATKVANAMAAEAVGAIIYNNVSGNFSGTLGTEDNNGTPWIAAISLSQADGQTLLANFVNMSVTLVNAPTRWDFFDGTSMATPHVAGIAGLVLGKNPSLSPNDVRTILDSTATDLGASGYDTVFGHGLVNATAALAATPLSTP